MKTIVVRYQTKPERASENQDLVEDVPAFQAFLAGVADRCEVAPVATGATVVGGYR